MKRTKLPYLQMFAFVVFCTVIILNGRFVWTKPTETLGYFTIDKNAWGTAIYQEGLHNSIQFNGFEKHVRVNNLVTLKRTQTNASTIDFGRDDILFDDEGTLYTESKMQEIATISKDSGLSLIKIQTTNRLSIPASDRLFLINPRVPGALVITFPGNATVTVDLERKAIGFSHNVTMITVETFANIADIPKNL